MWNNELVTAVSIWTVGYVIGQVPVNLLLTRVPPRYVISGVSLDHNYPLLAASLS